VTSEILAVDDDLRLRLFAGDPDVDAAWPWYRDLATVALVDAPGEPAYGRDRVAAMYAALAAQGEVYMVELCTPDGWTAVGDVTLAPDTLPIVLAPEHRGHGIGRRVVLRLVDRARVLGWTHLRVREVLPGNEASHRLFTGLGFLPVDLGDPVPDGPSRAYVLALAPLGGRPRE
jgi:GNAT superfamily N-acetyltransferase